MSRFAPLFLLFATFVLPVQAEQQHAPSATVEPDLRLVMLADPNWNEKVSAECLLRMLDRVGLHKTRDDIEYLPWARALETLKRSPRTAIVSIYRTPERAPLFKWVGPITFLHNGFIARRDANITVADPVDLRALRTGAILGSFLIKRIVDLTPLEESDLTLVSSPAQGIRMLQLGRLDVYAAPTISTAALMHRHGMKPSDYEVILPLGRFPLYYAFSPDVDDAFIAALQAELDALKRPGPDGRSEYDAVVTKHAKGEDIK